MNISLANLSSAAPDAQSVSKSVKAARDFEALLLTPVLNALEDTFGGAPDDSKMPGASDYRRMATQALAQAMVARGGIGIADMVLRHLPRSQVRAGSGTEV